MSSESPTAVDPEAWFQTRRRELLGGAGATATAATAGCGDAAPPRSTDAPVRERAVQQRDREATDHGGDYLGESTPVARIDVEELSGNRRDGTTVYYHPDEPGPYSDLEEAVDVFW
jgi:hypothetical protein